MVSVLNSFSNKILLSNLIKIRWVAIIGQLFGILISYYYFNVIIPFFICLLIVFTSILVNIFSFYFKNNTNYLSDKEAFFFLLYDTIQLAILLYLTGGIYNPFSLLLIAPIVISASYLPFFFSNSLLFLSICGVIFISNKYLPIKWGDPFEIPLVFKY